ncbi:MAG: SAM-dependent methyltransferase [Streptosporangiales bacterium]|nr:SAM-dependent methyltransferase [Streptosporangiales bacterium]
MPDFDAKSPNMARVYETLIGGKDNYEPDRDAASELAGVSPDVPLVYRENKQFATGAAAWLASQGVTQFLDLACGMPAAPNTHETVQELNPDARVAYVDLDPVAVNHMSTFARPGSGVTAAVADAADPAAVRAAVAGTIDFTRPVALLLCALVHFCEPGTARDIVAGNAAGLAPGSYLAVSALRPGGAATDEFVRVYSQAVAPVRPYSSDELAGLLRPLELVEPGVAALEAWRPGWPTVPPASRERDVGGYGVLARVDPAAG